MFFTVFHNFFISTRKKPEGWKTTFLGPINSAILTFVGLKKNKIDKEAKIIYMNFLINHVREAARGEAVSSPTPTPYNSE